MNAHRRPPTRQSSLLQLALHGAFGAALGCLVGFVIAMAPADTVKEWAQPDFAEAIVMAGFASFFAVGSMLTGWILIQIERA